MAVYTRTAVARNPCVSWAFLLTTGTAFPRVPPRNDHLIRNILHLEALDERKTPPRCLFHSVVIIVLPSGE